MTSQTIYSESEFRAFALILEGILTILRKGIADEELAKNEALRSRKRKVKEYPGSNGPHTRSRSISSSSSTSISTISTNLSRSPTSRRTNRHDAKVYHDSPKHTQALFSQDPVHKRRRSSSMSTTSYISGSSIDKRRKYRSREAEYLRHSSLHEKGGEPHERKSNPPRSTGKRRRSFSSSSSSYTSDSSHEGRRRDVSMSEHRNTRRRRSSISPERRGRNRNHDGRNKGRMRSRSDSIDRSQVARNRHSMTPGRLDRRDRSSIRSRMQGQRSLRDYDRRVSNDDDRYGSSFRDENHDKSRRAKPPRPPSPRKERSLSPFSKRLALTQAMNMGH